MGLQEKGWQGKDPSENHQETSINLESLKFNIRSYYGRYESNTTIAILQTNAILAKFWSPVYWLAF